MKLSGIKRGDIVQCDVRGRQFLATVTKPVDPSADGAFLEIEPVHKAITYRHVGARQVTAHWAKRGRPRATVDAPVA